jgi:hypothetical protein
MAIRQVGLMGRYDPLDVMTSNNTQIGFVDYISGSYITNAERNEIGDQTVEVLRTAPGPYFVETTVGDDGSTVVTSDINKGASYFSTPNTIVAAVDQGYFATAAAYVPRNVATIQANPLWQAGVDQRAAEIAAAYELVEGRSGLIDNSTVYDLSIPASAAGGDWWGEG